MISRGQALEKLETVTLKKLKKLESTFENKGSDNDSEKTLKRMREGSDDSEKTLRYTREGDVGWEQDLSGFEGAVHSHSITITKTCKWLPRFAGQGQSSD